MDETEPQEVRIQCNFGYILGILGIIVWNRGQPKLDQGYRRDIRTSNH